MRILRRGLPELFLAVFVSTLLIVPAYAQAAEWHVVDDEGYLFADASSVPQERLVVIQGVESPRDARTALKVSQLNTDRKSVV